MVRNLGYLVVLTVALLFVLPSVGFAASETVSGMVQEVDIDHKRLVISTDTDKTREFTVPKELLKGIEPGEEVTLQIDDGKVVALDQNVQAQTEERTEMLVTVFLNR